MGDSPRTPVRPPKAFFLTFHRYSMRKLKVAVVDILGKSVSKMSYSRHMRANNQSIGAQVVAVWW